jgi:hypothetical protein
MKGGRGTESNGGQLCISSHLASYVYPLPHMTCRYPPPHVTYNCVILLLLPPPPPPPFFIKLSLSCAPHPCVIFYFTISPHIMEYHF